jgi:hypothetical protein
MRRLPSLRALPLLAPFGLALLGGCAPLATLRPASGLAPGRSLETGMGVVTLGPRPYVDEETTTVGQLWVTGEPKRWLALSGILGYDAQAFAAGGAVRWNTFRSSRFAAGVEGELGFAWAGSSLNFAVSPLDNQWLYVGPRISTIGFDWELGIPVGVSVDLGRGMIVRAEAQLSWAELMYYNQRQHLALALVHQL